MFSFFYANGDVMALNSKPAIDKLRIAGQIKPIHAVMYAFKNNDGRILQVLNIPDYRNVCKYKSTGKENF